MKKEIKDIINRTKGDSLIERLYKISNVLQQLHDNKILYNFHVKDEGGWIRVYYQVHRIDNIEYVDDLISIRKKKLERILNV